MKKAIIIVVVIIVLFVGFGIFNVRRNYNNIMESEKNVKLEDVDAITANRLVNYHKDIFTYCGLLSRCVTEGIYNTESKNLYLNSVNDGSLILNVKTLYVYVEDGNVHTIKDEVMDFNEYKNNDENIYFTGDEYVKLLNSYGCNL